MAKAGRPPLDPARQRERADRILDAAAELVLRWGYGKTTVDDVAKHSGVAKGTIYLHWRTRDDLFAALLRRERVRMLEEVRASAPASLGELFGGFVGATLRRPLLSAALVGDAEVLGRFTRMKRSSTTGLEMGEAFNAYLKRLIAHGAVHEAHSDHQVVISAIVYGFVRLPDLLPEQARPSDERIADLVADSIERALGTGRKLSKKDARAVAEATQDLLGSMEEVADRRLAESLNSKERAR
ncbi:TetR/AcrR family transcriptional regulator [Allokutzneria albata]|uniref:DNA-binding transcriptional regulator, AcrR family n=1 Tax=Allokutzneria albata TaxID=211114 RepID=A0A1G9SE61_ALLAB|nr:TetR/AcrR family transcriptional regulator [Allokutzneria albata]SDM33758.1 DNA-binding transcriptional regulator, AcrR family [Allokutzneria albata]